jgi:hypothetical protein
MATKLGSKPVYGPLARLWDAIEAHEKVLKYLRKQYQRRQANLINAMRLRKMKRETEGTVEDFRFFKTFDLEWDECPSLNNPMDECVFIGEHEQFTEEEAERYGHEVCMGDECVFCGAPRERK